MDWIACFFAFMGMAILIFRKHWLNFVAFCVSDICMIVYLWPKGEWRSIALFGTYLAFQGYGAVRWTKINGGEQ